MARSTQQQIRQLDQDLRRLIEQAGPPVTARQTYYMAVANGLVAKTHNGYRQVLRRLSAMREAGTLPWSAIADNTRWVRQVTAYDSPEDALATWQAQYRKDYWATQSTRVELWVESDSIASFLSSLSAEYGLPMYVCRGQASKTFIHGAAQTAEQIGKPISILYVGDLDPTGIAIDASLEQRYNQYGDSIDLTLNRVTVTPEHVDQYGLFGTPIKGSDSNAAKYRQFMAARGLDALAYETEALPPESLRQIVRQAINATIDHEAWYAAKQYEQAEKQLLANLLTQ